MTQALEHLLTTSFLVLNHATQNVFYTSIGGVGGGGGGGADASISARRHAPIIADYWRSDQTFAPPGHLPPLS